MTVSQEAAEACNPGLSAAPSLSLECGAVEFEVIDGWHEDCDNTGTSHDRPIERPLMWSDVQVQLLHTHNTIFRC